MKEPLTLQEARSDALSSLGREWVSAYQQTKRGKELLEKNNLPAAKEAFLLAAASNEPFAFMELAELSRTNNDIETVIHYLRLALSSSENLFVELQDASDDDLSSNLRDIACESATILGGLFSRKADHVNSENYFRKAMSLAQGVQLELVAEQLGSLFVTQKRTAESIEVFQRGAEAGSGKCALLLGSQHFSNNNITAALDAFRLADRLGEPDAKQFISPLENFVKKRPDSTIQDFTQAETYYQQHAHESGWAALQLGNVHRFTNRPDNAREAYQKAIDLGCSNAWIALAELTKQEQGEQDCVDILQKGCDAGNPTATFLLARKEEDSTKSYVLLENYLDRLRANYGLNSPRLREAALASTIVCYPQRNPAYQLLATYTPPTDAFSFISRFLVPIRQRLVFEIAPFHALHNWILKQTPVVLLAAIVAMAGLSLVYMNFAALRLPVILAALFAMAVFIGYMTVFLALRPFFRNIDEFEYCEFAREKISVAYLANRDKFPPSQQLHYESLLGIAHNRVFQRIDPPTFSGSFSKYTAWLRTTGLPLTADGTAIHCETYFSAEPNHWQPWNTWCQ